MDSYTGNKNHECEAISTHASSRFLFSDGLRVAVEQIRVDLEALALSVETLPSEGESSVYEALAASLHFGVARLQFVISGVWEPLSDVEASRLLEVIQITSNELEHRAVLIHKGNPSLARRMRSMSYRCLDLMPSILDCLPGERKPADLRGMPTPLMPLLVAA
ncbi:MAG: hypothetical protein AAGJ31_02370 [Verrucomicrobiota bacterium]